MTLGKAPASYGGKQQPLGTTRRSQRLWTVDESAIQPAAGAELADPLLDDELPDDDPPDEAVPVELEPPVEAEVLLTELLGVDVDFAGPVLDDEPERESVR